MLVKQKIRNFRVTEFYNFQTAHRSAACPNRNFAHCSTSQFRSDGDWSDGKALLMDDQLSAADTEDYTDMPDLVDE